MKIDLEKATRRIRRRILADVTDRRGWKQEYELFSPDTRLEIAEAWDGIIRYELLLATGELARLKKQNRAQKV